MDVIYKYIFNLKRNSRHEDSFGRNDPSEVVVGALWWGTLNEFVEGKIPTIIASATARSLLTQLVSNKSILL